MPVFPGETPDRMHDGLVDLQAVGLAQADYEDTAMVRGAIFREALVRGMFTSTRILIRQRLAAGIGVTCSSANSAA